MTERRAAMHLSSVQASHRAAVLEKLRSGAFSFEDVPACLCAAPGGVRVAAHDRFGIPIGVLACPACGLLRTSPRLAAAHLPAFYESDYHGLHFGIEQPTPATTLVRHGQGDAIWAFCADLLRSPAPGDRLRVVDIGAGTGAVLRELAAAAAADKVEVETVGCEYSSSFAATARKRGTEVRTGGIETLVSTGLKPDLVIMSHVLEHFADPVGDLGLVRSLVQPDTVVYVEVPGLLTIHTKPQYDYLLERYLTLAHTYHFTLETLAETMGRGGFELIRGDEEVRAVFRLADGSQPNDLSTDPGPASPRGSRLPELLTYLRWLERSPRMRLKRAVLRARRRGRATLSGLARRLIGRRGVSAVRGLLHR